MQRRVVNLPLTFKPRGDEIAHPDPGSCRAGNGSSARCRPSSSRTLSRGRPPPRGDGALNGVCRERSSAPLSDALIGRKSHFLARGQAPEGPNTPSISARSVENAIRVPLSRAAQAARWTSVPVRQARVQGSAPANDRLLLRRTSAPQAVGDPAPAVRDRRAAPTSRPRAQETEWTVERCAGGAAHAGHVAGRYGRIRGSPPAPGRRSRACRRGVEKAESAAPRRRDLGDTGTRGRHSSDVTKEL